MIFSITNINGGSSSLGVQPNEVLSLLSATASYSNAIAVGLEPVVATLLRDAATKRGFDKTVIINGKKEEDIMKQEEKVLQSKRGWFGRIHYMEVKEENLVYIINGMFVFYYN